jgi:ABC-type transport system involved in multi-copper enzyme maturation permease subunit
MGGLIKAELLKLSKSLGYKVLLGVSLGLGFSEGLTSMGFFSDSKVTGYELFAASILGYTEHSIFFSIFAAVFICNEFTNRTFDTALVSGKPRSAILLAKIVVFQLGLIPIVFIKALLGGAMASFTNGVSPEPFLSVLPQLLFLIFGSIISSVAIGSICILLAMLIKNVGGTIGTGFGVAMAGALLINFEQLRPILKFIYHYQIAQTAQPESLGLYYGVIFGTILLATLASVIVFNKSELK